jgi:hypothetical protein
MMHCLELKFSEGSQCVKWCVMNTHTVGFFSTPIFRALFLTVTPLSFSLAKAMLVSGKRRQPHATFSIITTNSILSTCRPKG